MACQELRRTLIGSIRTLGTFMALPITGFVSDRWGRRTALAINAFNTAWMGIVRYWANTYTGFAISQFVEAAVGSGTFSCIYILCKLKSSTFIHTFIKMTVILFGVIMELLLQLSVVVAICSHLSF